MGIITVLQLNCNTRMARVEEVKLPSGSNEFQKSDIDGLAGAVSKQMIKKTGADF